MSGVYPGHLVARTCSTSLGFNLASLNPYWRSKDKDPFLAGVKDIAWKRVDEIGNPALKPKVWRCKRVSVHNCARKRVEQQKDAKEMPGVLGERSR